MHGGVAPALRGLAGIAALFLLLELASRAGIVDPDHLPPASHILLATLRVLLDPDFLRAVAATVAGAALGLGLAILLAVPLGVAIGSSRRTSHAATAVVELLRPIPSVALIPIAILLLGRGLDMKVALAAYASLWPVLINTAYGVRQVEPLALETARGFGLGRLGILRHVALPSAAPFVYTGVRISSAIAIVVAISAELVAGGGEGIGVWMLERSQAGVPRELLYAGLVVAGLLGLAVNTLLATGERRLFAWHHRVRGP